MCSSDLRTQNLDPGGQGRHRREIRLIPAHRPVEVEGAAGPYGSVQFDTVVRHGPLESPQRRREVESNVDLPHPSAVEKNRVTLQLHPSAGGRHFPGDPPTQGKAAPHLLRTATGRAGHVERCGFEDKIADPGTFPPTPGWEKNR